MDLHYFKNELQTEMNQLKTYIKFWEEKLENKINLPESARGYIYVAVGFARLLIQQRFTQFSQSIRDCEFNSGSRVVNLYDLQAFWDMIGFQVEEVKRHFHFLHIMEINNWEERELVFNHLNAESSSSAFRAGSDGHSKSFESSLPQKFPNAAQYKKKINKTELREVPKATRASRSRPKVTATRSKPKIATPRSRPKVTAARAKPNATARSRSKISGARSRNKTASTRARERRAAARSRPKNGAARSRPYRRCRSNVDPEKYKDHSLRCKITSAEVENFYNSKSQKRSRNSRQNRR